MARQSVMQLKVILKLRKIKKIFSQLVAYKSLVERNRELERQEGRPREDAILYLPFIIINTAKKTFIDCAISHDKFVSFCRIFLECSMVE